MVAHISNKEKKRISSDTYLGILLDETLTWKDNIRVIEKKNSKNLGLLYKIIITIS